MSFSFGTVELGDASFGTVALGQITFGSTVIWEAIPEDCIIFEVDKGVKDLELPLASYGSQKWVVNWGDGKEETQVTKHSYTDAATENHLVTIYGGQARWVALADGDYANFTKGPNASIKNGLISVQVYGKCPIVSWNACAFNGCTKLASVADGLFNNIVLREDSAVCHSSARVQLDCFFYKCSSLKSVGVNLMKDAYTKRGLKSLSFSNMFYGSGLTAVAAGFFPSFPAISWSSDEDGSVSFNGMFGSCNSLSSIGSIFNNLPTSVQSIDFGFCFANCAKLASIPDYLFKNMPSLGGSSYLAHPIVMNSMFYQSGLTAVPANILNGVPNNKKVDMSSFFGWCTGIKGNVPTVWSTHGNTVHTYFYSNCSGASNYSSIPSGWK